jgi:hypothetical protein
MRSMLNRIAMVGVAAALLGGAATSASAQTWGWNDSWNSSPMAGSYGQTYGGYYGPTYGGGALIQAPVAGRLDYTPYASTLGWRTGRCVTDEGYGRTLPCDHGGGF